eukprot:841898-Prorocentrum_minimum.AAC.1
MVAANAQRKRKLVVDAHLFLSNDQGLKGDSGLPGFPSKQRGSGGGQEGVRRGSGGGLPLFPSRAATGSRA